jgi:hypothetical protein
MPYTMCCQTESQVPMSCKNTHTTPLGNLKGPVVLRMGGVLLGVSIEAGNQHECSSPHEVSYEPGCDGPCMYKRTKSNFDKNAEEWAPTATETQGDPSKGAEDEETARTFKIKFYKSNDVHLT